MTDHKPVIYRKLDNSKLASGSPTALTPLNYLSTDLCIPTAQAIPATPLTLGEKTISVNTPNTKPVDEKISKTQLKKRIKNTHMLELSKKSEISPVLTNRRHSYSKVSPA